MSVLGFGVPCGCFWLLVFCVVGWYLCYFVAFVCLILLVEVGLLLLVVLLCLLLVEFLDSR